MITLPDNDWLIIEARTSAIPLKDLSEDEFDASITGIIFNISVICGCQLPTHNVHVNALEKEFLIFLRDNGYSDFTSNEILLAFRMNANFLLPNKIEVYGAIFNIDFAGKVLRQYDLVRSQVDAKVGDFYTNKQREELLESEAQARRVKAKSQFEKYLQDDKAELDLSNVFMQLADDGAFANRSAFRGFTTKRVGEVESVSGVFEKIISQMDVEFESQKAVVRFLFLNMKKTGRTVLYDDSWKLVNPNFELPTTHHADGN